MYSATYKRCPFCNGDGTGRWDDLEKAVLKASADEVSAGAPPVEELPLEEEEEEPRAGARGGKRLMSGSSGGSYGGSYGGGGPTAGQVLGAILGIAFIVAAVCIIISLIKPLLGRDKDTAESATPSAPVVESAAPQGSQGPMESTAPQESQSAGESLPPASQAPAVVPTQAPDPTVPTGFSLSTEDFTLFSAGESHRIAVTFQPATASAGVSWSSSNEAVATVSGDGRVTAVSRGTCTVTAAVEGLGKHECVVRCALNPTTAPVESGGQGEGGEGTAPVAIKLNREDFTLSHAGETWKMEVTGTASPVTWATSKESVATIAEDGTVTAVGRGVCTVTAQVDGLTLKCIVRCSF